MAAAPTAEEGVPPAGDLGTFDAAVRARVSAKATNAGINLDGELAPLADLAAATSTIDGAYFTQLILAGYANIVRAKLNLNKINVFPIPDGDTGNNMVICMKNPIKGLFTEPQASVVDAATNLAADVLLYGQGNSGTILSHFFIQLAEGIKAVAAGAESITSAQFATAVATASAAMKDAVPDVVEGTMISVARDCGQDLAPTDDTVKAFVAAWLEKGEAELALTPERLQVDGKFVLKEAGVVDSGAKGFVDMIGGMAAAIAGDEAITAMMKDGKVLSRVSLDTGEDVPLDVDHTVIDSKFQFCTEALIKLKEDATKETIMAALEAEQAAGNLDSIAIVCAPSKSGGTMAKAHFHTNDPGACFAVCSGFCCTEGGRLEKEKVEDMYMEREDEHGGPQYDLSKAKFAVVTDHCVSSTLSEQKLTKLIPVYVIPESTGDPVTVGDPENFPPLPLFQKLRNEPERVFTAAPTPINVQFILEEALESSEHAIVLGLAEWASATFRNINQAMLALPADKQARITIVNTGYAGTTQTHMMKELLRAAEKGESVEAALERMYYVERRSYHFWTLDSGGMKAIVASGRAPDLGDGSGIVDGQLFCRGNMPRPDNDPMSKALPWGTAGEIGAPRPTVVLPIGSDMSSMMKPATMLGAVAQCGLGDEEYEAMITTVFDKIKANIGPNRVLKDVVINAIGRPDIAHKLAGRVRAELPVASEKEVSVVGDSALFAAMGGWGNSGMVFWVDEAKPQREPRAEAEAEPETEPEPDPPAAAPAPAPAPGSS